MSFHFDSDGDNDFGPPAKQLLKSDVHDFDADCICTKCGFDGAEWWHWKHKTYEGMASDEKEPKCGAA